MINSFNIIKYILLYYLMSNFIKAFIVKVTGSYLAGILFVEASILIIFFLFITYSMQKGYHRIRIDWIKILLLLLIIGGIAQSIYFLISFNETGLDLVVRAFAPFRKYLFPLLLFSVFSTIIYNDFKKNGEMVFDRLLKYTNLILLLAVSYQIAEALLRMIPAFNSFYIDHLIAPAMNAELESSSQLSAFSEMTKTYFPLGLRIKIIRSFGIGLDYFVSGSIMLLCYIYNALFSKKYKMMSLSNLAIAIAIILTGSLQFIIPFIIFNVYELLVNRKSSNAIKIIIGIILVSILLGFLPRIFQPDYGYGAIYFYVLPDVMQNLNLFIFGMGPVRTNLDIENTLIGNFGSAKTNFLDKVTDIGFFMIAIELGLLLFLLILMFYFCVGNVSVKRKEISHAQKENVAKLKFMNIFCLFVFISHYLILFSRTTYVYCILFLSLAYAYSVYLREGNHEKDTG